MQGHSALNKELNHRLFFS